MPAQAAAKKTTTARKAPAGHPPVATMVTEAITSLKERNGSSLPAIKKYIAGHFECDVQKLAPFIKKFLKKSVADGKIKQVKASYKVDKNKIEKPKKPANKPATKPKRSLTKKAAAKPKKVKTPKKAAPEPKSDKPKKSTKSPKKATKPAKVEKPKKVKTPKKAAAKPKKPAAKKATKKPAKK